MALVDKDQMTVLRTAAESKATAASAADEVQLKAIAFAINTAANSGQTRTEFLEEISEANIAKLKAKQYELNPTGQGSHSITVISWKA